MKKRNGMSKLLAILAVLALTATPIALLVSSHPAIAEKPTEPGNPEEPVKHEPTLPSQFSDVLEFPEVEYGGYDGNWLKEEILEIQNDFANKYLSPSIIENLKIENKWMTDNSIVNVEFDFTFLGEDQNSFKSRELYEQGLKTAIVTFEETSISSEAVFEIDLSDVELVLQEFDVEYNGITVNDINEIDEDSRTLMGIDVYDGDLINSKEEFVEFFKTVDLGQRRQYILEKFKAANADLLNFFPNDDDFKLEITRSFFALIEEMEWEEIHDSYMMGRYIDGMLGYYIKSYYEQVPGLHPDFEIPYWYGIRFIKTPPSAFKVGELEDKYLQGIFDEYQFKKESGNDWTEEKQKEYEISIFRSLTNGNMNDIFSESEYANANQKLKLTVDGIDFATIDFESVEAIEQLINNAGEVRLHFIETSPENSNIDIAYKNNTSSLLKFEDQEDML
ncbi:hypothetical protein [[Acholeplasma] multilocale]|uniref:hypothetical protein n=1 Tax=[Acholeplasma] multilocale TaxID=264638 RepID=UPI000479FE70|nr:hypothetical protein [[Acholeplasma] multilocale]